MRLLKSHAMRAKQAQPSRDERLQKADQEYQEWLTAQRGSREGIRHPTRLIKARPLQGSIDFNGLPVSIETGRSRCREWYNSQDDTQGMSRMTLPYGYIKGTMGTDGDQVDVFVGADRQAVEVYVVHTTKAPEFAGYDEDKCFLGVASPEEALRYFKASYNDPRFFGSMSIWPFEEFKEAVYQLKGKRLDNTKYILPPESANGITGPGRLITDGELHQAAIRYIEQRSSGADAEPIKKSGEAMCKQIGDSMGIDWKQYDLDEFCDGMFDEQEHADVVDGDQEKIARIVLEHLDEDPEYYSHMQTAKDAGIMKSLLSKLGR